MSEMELSYLSALIDGEGCITIGWQLNGGYLIARPIIKIGLKKSNKTLELMNYLKKTFGGSCGNYKGTAEWSVSSYSDLQRLIPKIKKYLKLKEDSATLLLDAVSILKEERSSMYLPHSLKTIKKIAEITKKIDELKGSSTHRKIWRYDKIIDYAISSGRYTEENRQKVLDKIIEYQKNNKGRLKILREKLKIPEIEEKRIKAIRKASKKRARQLYPDSVVQEACKLYNQRYSVKEISDKLKINYWTVWEWIKRGGRSWSLI